MREAQVVQAAPAISEPPGRRAPRTSAETSHIPAMPNRTSASSATGRNVAERVVGKDLCLVEPARRVKATSRPARTSGPAQGGAGREPRPALARLRSALAPGSVIASASAALRSVVIATSSPRIALPGKLHRDPRRAARPFRASGRRPAGRGRAELTERDASRTGVADQIVLEGQLLSFLSEDPGLRSVLRPAPATRPGPKPASGSDRRRRTYDPATRRRWPSDGRAPTSGQGAPACSCRRGREGGER